MKWKELTKELMAIVLPYQYFLIYVNLSTVSAHVNYIVHWKVAMSMAITIYLEG